MACGHPTAVSPTRTEAPSSSPAKMPVPPRDPCAPESGPATEILRAFRADLLSAAGKDSPAFQQTAQDKIAALTAAFRGKNGKVLAEHAAWSFKRLPKLTLPDLDTMPDAPRVTVEVAARMRTMVSTDQEKDGFSLRSFLELFSSDPILAFAGIRGAVLSAVGGPGDLDRVRENILEGLAPPRMVRLNDDVDHPVLAMPKRADIFVVCFDHDVAQGTFMPKRIRWVRRDPPLEPRMDIKTAEEAFLSFATAVEASPPEEGVTTANLSMRLLAQVGELGKQWLDPYALLLREHGACLCKRVAPSPIPDLSDWKEEEGRWNVVPQTSMFPRLRWDPLQAFLFLRATVDSRTLLVGDYSGLALVDSLVPPTVFRASDDLANPVLFLVERDTALVVLYSSSRDRGYFPTQVRYFRRN
jgi:hypothetical protein